LFLGNQNFEMYSKTFGVGVDDSGRDKGDTLNGWFRVSGIEFRAFKARLTGGGTSNTNR